jgi:hypothetical protein
MADLNCEVHPKLIANQRSTMAAHSPRPIIDRMLKSANENA